MLGFTPCRKCIRKQPNATLANVHRCVRFIFPKSNSFGLIKQLTMDLTHILICLVCYFLTDIDALMFHLAPNTKKCLKEEIHKDVLVTGEYSLSDAPGHKTSLIVGFIVILIYHVHFFPFGSTCYPGDMGFHAHTL